MSITHQTSDTVVERKVPYKDGVIVKFELANEFSAENINMDVYIYTQQNSDKDLSLVGNAEIRNNRILFERFPNDLNTRKYYLIGMEYVQEVRKSPSLILG